MESVCTCPDSFTTFSTSANPLPVTVYCPAVTGNTMSEPPSPATSFVIVPPAADANESRTPGDGGSTAAVPSSRSAQLPGVENLPSPAAPVQA